MDSELAKLMPNNIEQGLNESTVNTLEIRRYMQANPVLGERSNIPFGEPMTMKKHRLSELEIRRGSGRMPQAKRFCIRIKRQAQGPALPEHAVQLDPEELKDALLQQAIAQRRALVAASLRPGTGRAVTRPHFKIVIKPPVPSEQLAFDMPGACDGSGHVNSSQMAQGMSRTPVGLLGHYPSPMEGVPEHGSNPALPGPPPRAYTPVAGLGELHQIYRPNTDARRENVDDDSPVEGLVHQTYMHGAGGAQPQNGHTDLAGFSFPAAPDGDGRANHGYEDDDFGGGFDDGGWDGWGDADAAMDGDGDAMPPPPPRGTPRPKVRRVVQNPGIRLRNELPRKSLAIDISVGRREVAPGVRRSTRQAQEPLRWWLGEKKLFDRIAHKTMPTIINVTHADANTPWRTIADPKEWKKSRKAYRPKSRKPTNQGDDGSKRKEKPASDITDVDAEGGRPEEDDEIEIRGVGVEHPSTAWSDEETEVLPRAGDAHDDASSSDDEIEGADEAQGVTPVRHIDLTSPHVLNLVSPGDHEEEVDADAATVSPAKKPPRSAMKTPGTAPKRLSGSALKETPPSVRFTSPKKEVEIAAVEDSQAMEVLKFPDVDAIELEEEIVLVEGEEENAAAAPPLSSAKPGRTTRAALRRAQENR